MATRCGRTRLGVSAVEMAAVGTILLAGFYDLASGKRLPLVGSDGQLQGDAITIAVLEVGERR